MKIIITVENTDGSGAVRTATKAFCREEVEDNFYHAAETVLFNAYTDLKDKVS